ncbi:pre-RNA processing PIH1/Nop17-domain-containing protein [Flagelloscypha sp. PMI_526]|nr:pre-RNA processing PIH1/Nop17-domain-containing protein [Flagelloscypha sp. PMI_526]
MTEILVTPKPGFCIKTSTQNEVLWGDLGKTVPKNVKIFINICYHDSIPAPTPTSSSNLPVVLSSIRPDTDKAGSPAITLEAVLHPDVKSRILRNQDVKIDVAEAALLKIEEHVANGLSLGRKLGTPNLASKGKLVPRKVAVSTSRLDHDNQQKPLIEEMKALPEPKKSILKPSTVQNAGLTDVFSWRWAKTDQGKLEVRIRIPSSLTKSQIEATSLLIEPRRLILTLPAQPAELDINLNKSDAEIVTTSSSSSSGYLTPSKGETEGDETQRLLQLKRQRPFNVEDAHAEWRIATSTLTVTL